MSRIDGQGGLGGIKALRETDTSPLQPQEASDQKQVLSAVSDSAELKATPEAGTSLSDLVAKAKEAAGQTAAPKPEPSEGLLGRLWGGVKHEAAAIEHGAGSALDEVESLGKSAGSGIGGFFGGIGGEYQKLVFGASNAQFKTRQIEYDPSDVNKPDSSEIEQATSDLPANAAAERAAVAKLSAGDQQKYQAIADQAQANPMARRELQKMLLDGRLPGAKDLQGQGTLLDHLHTLATEQLADGVDRKQLVNDVLGEVENPVRIDQQQKGTCGAATAQILLARKHPAEYVRLISDLARPEGQAKMAGGDTLKRVDDWANPNDSGRSVSSRLLQPALMNEAAGSTFPGASYNNSSDKDKELFLSVGSGMSDGGSAKINSQLEGVRFESEGVHSWNRDGSLNRLKEVLGRGKGPIPVSLRFNVDGRAFGHFVQVDKIEQGRVYYTNPWGAQESLSEEEFKSHVTGMQVPNHAL